MKRKVVAICIFALMFIIAFFALQFYNEHQRQLAFQFLTKQNDDPVICPKGGNLQRLTQSDIADQFIKIATWSLQHPTSEAIIGPERDDIEGMLFEEFKRCVVAKGAEGCRSVAIKNVGKSYEMKWHESYSDGDPIVYTWIGVMNGIEQKSVSSAAASVPGCDFTGKVG